MENPKVILKRSIVLAMTVFLLALLRLDGSVFATIDPNNYSINWSIQNKDQGVEIVDGSTSERYVGMMRTLSLSTNAPSGYRVYVNVPAGESSGGNMLLLGGTSSDPSLSKLGTTPATASVLTTDSWGFGIPNSTSGLPTNNFSPTYSNTPSSTNTYSGVVVSPGITLIRNKQGSVSGTDSFNVYYGMRVGTDVLTHPGTYQTKVSYHALIEATDVVGGEATITPTSGPKSGFETVTITTSLKTDFIPSDISVTLDQQECDNPRGNISTGVLRITCVTRAHAPDTVDVAVNINSLGISYTIADGYEYLETGDVSLTNIVYVSGNNVSGTPNPSISNDGSIDFDLTFRGNSQSDDQTFSATYRLTLQNTTSSDYIFTAPSSNLTLRLSATTTSDVYYELGGISVGDIVPANSTVTFTITLTADYASGTHGVEGGMEVEPVEDKSGAVVGTISGTTTGDLSGNNELTQFQVSVQNTFSSAKTFTLDVLGSDFVIANSTGGYFDIQTIPAESTQTYTFYLKKSPDAIFGSDYVNAMITLSYDGIDTNVGQVRIHVDQDPSYVDNQAPIISNVTVTRGNTYGTATLAWEGTDNVGIASYGIYVCTKNNDTYSCGNMIPVAGGNTNSYNLTGLSTATYGIVVVGFDDQGNTASANEINDATHDSGHASRTEDTELKYDFTVTGRITNGSLSNTSGTIRMGNEWSGTITPNNNYNRPGSVTVRMGGRTLTQNTDYTYQNGTVRITNVTGDIEVEGTCNYSCLLEGTLIALADGTTKPIEQITYKDLLKVWNYETGSVGTEYPGRIEKKSEAIKYQYIRFSDGSELKVSGWHGIFSVDENEYISVDDPSKFHVGMTTYKVENDQLVPITVVSSEMINEEVNVYHIISSRYYNVIANGILTTDGTVMTSNIYGFVENLKWSPVRDEFISNPDNLYTYEDFADIGMPRRMFDDFRIQEASYLEVQYGVTLDMFKQYLLENDFVGGMVPYDDE